MNVCRTFVFYFHHLLNSLASLSSYPASSESSAPPPQKEEPKSSQKDPAEPVDQQVDKKLPEPPKPSASDIKAEPVNPPKPKEAKTPKKEVEKFSKKEEKKDVSPAVSGLPGNRNETRVCFLSLRPLFPLLKTLFLIQVKMNRMRLRIAERLKQSQNAAASLTTFNEIDMSALVSLRKKYKENIQSEHGVKLGFMSFFARASVLALKEIPMANASIEGEEIVYRDFVDLSVAVATPKGLVTPVLRNAEGMSVLEIEKEIAALGRKARDGKLTLEDMAGGTFTMYVFRILPSFLALDLFFLSLFYE